LHRSPAAGATVIINFPGGEGERIRILDTAWIERLETKDVRQAN